MTHRRRKPARIRIKKSSLLKLLAIFVGILSLHGFYSYAHRNDWQLAEDLFTGRVKQGDLFFMISMPPILEDVVSWMSYEGGTSLFIPIVILAVCIFLWIYSKKVS